LDGSRGRDHVHLIVEADDSRALSRGVWRLATRIARAVNRVLWRRGPVWGDRYHVRALRTPREVRNSLVYVLQTFRKHMPHASGMTGLDPCFSAAWFDGFRGRSPLSNGCFVAHERTWLLRVGWRRHGMIGLGEQPRHA